PHARVAVYTEDMGMSLRCEANDVPVIEPDRKLRLRNPQTDQEKKHQLVINELNLLKHRAPSLTLRAVAPNVQRPEKSEPLAGELTSSSQSLDKEAELAKIRKKNPLIAGLPEGDPFGITETWNRYNDELEEFYVAYEVFLDNLNSWG